MKLAYVTEYDAHEIEKGEIFPNARFGDRSASIISNSSDKLSLSFKEQIALENLIFQYPGASGNSLDQISLVVQKGQSIGLIAKSGAGKTTLVDVLLGLFTPQSGDIKIARVLYHGREILVFDEATAALDTETEDLVTKATKSLAGSNTIIIIAYRLWTIEHCDRIYQIDGGRLVKFGSYQEVVLGHGRNI
jgi:ABC-type multidrug transport system fused ATPase/permease subunit